MLRVLLERRRASCAGWLLRAVAISEGRGRVYLGGWTMTSGPGRWGTSRWAGPGWFGEISSATAVLLLLVSGGTSLSSEDDILRVFGVSRAPRRPSSFLIDPRLRRKSRRRGAQKRLLKGETVAEQTKYQPHQQSNGSDFLIFFGERFG